MNELKKEIFRVILISPLYILAGFVLVKYTNWQVLGAIILLFFAHNLERHWRDK